MSSDGRTVMIFADKIRSLSERFHLAFLSLNTGDRAGIREEADRLPLFTDYLESAVSLVYNLVSELGYVP